MKKLVFIIFALLALFSTGAVQAQLQLAPDYSQAGARSGFQASSPTLEVGWSYGVLTASLRVQLADAFVSPLVGVDLGAPFRWEGPGGWTWSPIAHGYWAVTQGPGYRLGIEAQVAQWNQSRDWFTWHGVDISAFYLNDPILGQGFGFGAGITLNARPALLRAEVNRLQREAKEIHKQSREFMD